jgi:hypothetical protein
MRTRRKSDSLETGERGPLHGYVAADGHAGRESAAPAGPGTALVTETSWDPYEVWVTRVKQPREESVRTRRQERAAAEQPTATDLSDTARLRILTLAP